MRLRLTSVGIGHTVLRLDFLIQLLETFILRREAAFRCSVDDENDFAFVAFEGDGLAFFCWWEEAQLVRVLDHAMYTATHFNPALRRTKKPKTKTKKWNRTYYPAA